MKQYPWSHESRYDNATLIAEGGMGAVYSARDANLDRTVAIKVIRSNRPQSTDYRKRMKREIAALSKLEHPNIVRIFECNESPEGELYFTMELIEGVDLGRYIEQRHLRDEDVVKLFVPLVDALQALHDEHIIHRDIKASNILVTNDGIPKLIDLGLARLNDDNHTPLTGTNQVVGTVAFLPPEVFAGKPYTNRSDVYQLAFTLDLALRDRNWISDTRGLEELHPLLNAIISKAMAKKPEERFSSARSFQKALDSWLEGSKDDVRKLIGDRLQTNPKKLHEKAPFPKTGLALFLAAIAILLLYFAMTWTNFEFVAARLRKPNELLIVFRGDRKGTITISPRGKNEVSRDLALAQRTGANQFSISIPLKEPIVDEKTVTIKTPSQTFDHRLTGKDYVNDLLDEVKELLAKDGGRSTNKLGQLSFIFVQGNGHLEERRRKLIGESESVLAAMGVHKKMIGELRDFVPPYLGQNSTIFSKRYKKCLPLIAWETVVTAFQSPPPPWGSLAKLSRVQFKLANEPISVDGWNTVCKRNLIRMVNGKPLWYWLTAERGLANSSLMTFIATTNFGGRHDIKTALTKDEIMPASKDILTQLVFPLTQIPQASAYALLIKMKLFNRSGVLRIELGSKKTGYLHNFSSRFVNGGPYAFRRQLECLIPIKRNELPSDCKEIMIFLDKIEEFGVIPLVAMKEVQLLAQKG